MLPHPNFGREALMRPRFCLIPIVLVMAVAARAEVVILKNGDRLTGHWTSVVEAKLLFKSDVVGDVSIPIDQIRSFAPAETVVVLLPKGETVSGTCPWRTGRNSKSGMPAPPGPLLRRPSKPSIPRPLRERGAAASPGATGGSTGIWATACCAAIGQQIQRAWAWTPCDASRT